MIVIIFPIYIAGYNFLHKPRVIIALVEVLAFTLVNI